MAAGMRRIDLTCLIAAPIAVGFLMTYGGSRTAVAVRSRRILPAVAFNCSYHLRCFVFSQF
jgi:Ferroportin1 (FPN1)